MWYHFARPYQPLSKLGWRGIHGWWNLKDNMHEITVGTLGSRWIEIETHDTRYCWNIGCPSKTHLNTLRPRQNGRRFADDTFRRIFLNENVRVSIKISLNFVPNGPIDNIPSLVQIMAWRHPGDKPLSEPMMVILPKHIHVCVVRPQC